MDDPALSPSNALSLRWLMAFTINGCLGVMSFFFPFHEQGLSRSAVGKKKDLSTSGWNLSEYAGSDYLLPNSKEPWHHVIAVMLIFFYSEASESLSSFTSYLSMGASCCSCCSRMVWYSFSNFFSFFWLICRAEKEEENRVRTLRKHIN